jgi:hypothetical protein
MISKYIFSIALFSVITACTSTKTVINSNANQLPKQLQPTPDSNKFAMSMEEDQQEKKPCRWVKPSKLIGFYRQARMEVNGTLEMKAVIGSEEHPRYLGYDEYLPTDPEYQEILNYIGPIKPGETLYICRSPP